MEPDTKRQRTEASSNDMETTNNDAAAVPVSRDLYLDTINRHMLDFDFEKVCSVSMSNINIYACLVCGNYFQGTKRTVWNSFVTNLPIRQAVVNPLMLTSTACIKITTSS